MFGNPAGDGAPAPSHGLHPTDSRELNQTSSRRRRRRRSGSPGRRAGSPGGRRPGSPGRRRRKKPAARKAAGGAAAAPDADVAQFRERAKQAETEIVLFRLQALKKGIARAGPALDTAEVHGKVALEKGAEIDCVEERRVGRRCRCRVYLGGGIYGWVSETSAKGAQLFARLPAGEEGSADVGGVALRLVTGKRPAKRLAQAFRVWRTTIRRQNELRRAFDGWLRGVPKLLGRSAAAAPARSAVGLLAGEDFSPELAALNGALAFGSGRPSSDDGASSATSGDVSPVSHHDIAVIWVAFFSRCQRYRC